MEVREKKCSCGRVKAYEKCCGLIHEDIKLAHTAEDLMRSRYTAFTKGNGIYLMKSHHSCTKPTNSEIKETELWTKSVSWIKLEVLSCTKGTKNDNDGTVSFKAYYMEDSKVEVIYENSYFEKENGIWFYKSAL